jgi:hypothetical protein
MDTYDGDAGALGLGPAAAQALLLLKSSNTTGELLTRNFQPLKWNDSVVQSLATDLTPGEDNVNVGILATVPVNCKAVVSNVY